MMRRFSKMSRPGLLVVFASQFILGSCRKSTDALQGNGCISRFPLLVESTLTADQTDSIKAIFAKNNLPTEDLVFTMYNSDIPGANGQNTKVVQAAVKVNGLYGFDLHRVYSFSNDSLISTYPENFLAENTDTAARLSLKELQAIFLKHVSESRHILETFAYDPNSADLPPEYTAAEYKDTCLKAVLGYADDGSVISHALPQEITGPDRKVKKRWKITPASNQFPIVFADDQTGKGWGAEIY